MGLKIDFIGLCVGFALFGQQIIGPEKIVKGNGSILKRQLFRAPPCNSSCTS